jgi:hypothetical protein
MKLTWRREEEKDCCMRNWRRLEAGIRKLRASERGVKVRLSLCLTDQELHHEDV